MSEYANVKTGRLRLKGDKIGKKKSKKRKRDDDTSSSSSEFEKDLAAHGGWWKVKSINQMKGSVAIQLGSSSAYMKALDQGDFALGALHDEGMGPDPEEILTVVPVGNGKIALKSGYGKYLGVDSNGRVIGSANAIGSMEHFEPIFQDQKTALLAPNDCFVSVNEDDDVVARNVKAEENEMVVIRCNKSRELNKDSTPEEEKGSVKDVEINYIKKFQKFQDKRMKVCPEDRAMLKKAKAEGDFHEALLDRRSKMKADRYCK